MDYGKGWVLSLLREAICNPLTLEPVLVSREVSPIIDP